MSQETKTHQYLTFKLAGESFALPIEMVREVMDCVSITPIPLTPSFMLGVINLRGSVVPVVDLRLVLGLENTEEIHMGVIIVSELELEGDTILIGLLSNTVNEVVEMPKSTVDHAPSFGTNINTSYISGVGKKGDEFLVILNIEQVISENALAGLQASEMMPIEMMNPDKTKTIEERT